MNAYRQLRSNAAVDIDDANDTVDDTDNINNEDKRILAQRTESLDLIRSHNYTLMNTISLKISQYKLN